MKYEKLKKIVISVLFLLAGIFLPRLIGEKNWLVTLFPFLSGKNMDLNGMFLPMHIPVFLCGLICGWKYGGVIGFIVPLLRFYIFGRPALYPTAVGMAFELATYGAVSGALYREKNDTAWLYTAIIGAMIAGRVVWGVMYAILKGVEGEIFTFEMFVGTAIIEAIPGIILQFALIPAVMSAIDFVRKIKEKANDKISVQK